MTYRQFGRTPTPDLTRVDNRRTGPGGADYCPFGVGLTKPVHTTKE